MESSDLANILRYTIGITLLAAGITKFQNFSQFVEGVLHYQVLPPVLARWYGYHLCALCLLISVGCTPTGIPSTSPVVLTVQSPIATPPTSNFISSLTIVPSLTPSAVPTHSLESLKDKLPFATPAHGFILLEMPESVSLNGMITVTIFTASGAKCSIQYFGTTGGLSHAAGLEPQIADANGICSWTWKQAMGDKGASLLPITARINISANGDWEPYFLIVK